MAIIIQTAGVEKMRWELLSQSLMPQSARAILVMIPVTGMAQFSVPPRAKGIIIKSPMNSPTMALSHRLSIFSLLFTVLLPIDAQILY